MPRWVTSRLTTARAVYAQARALLGVPLLVLTVLGLWREVGPANRQPPLISELIEVLPWWGWALLAMAAIVLITFESAHSQTYAPEPPTRDEVADAIDLLGSTNLATYGNISALDYATQSRRDLLNEMWKHQIHDDAFAALNAAGLVETRDIVYESGFSRSGQSIGVKVTVTPLGRKVLQKL